MLAVMPPRFSIYLHVYPRITYATISLLLPYQLCCTGSEHLILLLSPALPWVTVLPKYMKRFVFPVLLLGLAVLIHGSELYFCIVYYTCRFQYVIVTYLGLKIGIIHNWTNYHNGLPNQISTPPMTTSLRLAQTVLHLLQISAVESSALLFLSWQQRLLCHHDFYCYLTSPCNYCCIMLVFSFSVLVTQCDSLPRASSVTFFWAFSNDPFVLRNEWGQ